MFHCIKQLEEKAVATEIDLLVWSDRMDLVALSNAKGLIKHKSSKIVKLKFYRRSCFTSLNMGESC